MSMNTMTSDFEAKRRETIKSVGEGSCGKKVYFPDAASILDIFPKIVVRHVKKENVLAKSVPWTKKRNAHAHLTGYLSLRPNDGERAIGISLTALEATPEFIEWWKNNTVHGEYSRFTFELIQWKDGQALLTMQNSQTCGSYWIAVVRSDEIPFALDYGDSAKHDGLEIVRKA